MKLENCVDCGQHWSTSKDYFADWPKSGQGASSSIPPTLVDPTGTPEPPKAEGSTLRFPPAVASPWAATGKALPVGLIAEGVVAASATAQGKALPRSSNTFADQDGRLYDVGLLKSARKTLEALFGQSHPSVREIDEKLAAHEQRIASQAPLHIAVGKAQKRLKALDSRIGKLSEEKQALVKQHASIVSAISERDRLLETAHAEHRMVQEELSKLAGCTTNSEAAFQLEAFGLGQAPQQIRDLATTLLLQIRQLAAVVMAGSTIQPAAGLDGHAASLVLPPSLAATAATVAQATEQSGGGAAVFKPTAGGAAWVPVPPPPPVMPTGRAAATAAASKAVGEDDDEFGSACGSPNTNGRNKSRSPRNAIGSKRSASAAGIAPTAMDTDSQDSLKMEPTPGTCPAASEEAAEVAKALLESAVVKQETAQSFVPGSGSCG